MTYTELLNPIEIEKDEKVFSFYSKTPYQLVEVKNGMAKMRNLITESIEDWNACNNRHFTRKTQLELF